ncbi:MAG TPA: glycoside hydrolase family 3 N-terminal domain-containing protein [Candidatus Izemoplasmatales bacterium]|nr:glycoside hydrolase family 3 N-terminal domain-containing protein [Candidatus Izemoplasmatales bacterium]
MKVTNNNYPDVIKQLVDEMTVEEKIGQLYQAPFFSDVVTGHAFDSSSTIDHIKKGMVGSVLSVHDEKTLYLLQKIAVEESRLGIPLLFAFDVIHGYKTSFPINLALSNTWDTDLIERVSKAVAYETAHKGIHLTFSPMLDLVRDPRWGRVMESNGEDPYLSGELGKAYIDGYQQGDLSHPNSVAACAKHFIAYGLSEAGREYNTVDLSERVLYNMYLPPFISAINADVSMVMTAFNTVFDRPATANKRLLKGLLRESLNFKGVIISDYTSTEEIIQHKVAKDEAEVALQCFDAGLEIEMVSKTYMHHLKHWLDEETLSLEALDQSVLKILKLKYDLGLFKNPYGYLYDNSDQYVLNEKNIQLSKEAAEKSMVLLKNDGLLPLDKTKKIVLCGTMVDSQDVIGEWAALTKEDDVTTIFQAFNSDQSYDVTADDSEETVRQADVIIMALGESGEEAGESNSKVDLHIDEKQAGYFDQIYQWNQNIVLVVFAGRPLIMTAFEERAKSILYAYQPGLQAGPAIKSLLTGQVVPSGKLTMTFPYHQGQIPIYYNHYQTGRPYDPKRPKYRYNSRYRDCQNEPLYPFGYGLSYASFKYRKLTFNQQSLKKYDKLLVSVDCTNDSSYEADEIIQLYIEALSFSIARPINELKAFKKVSFKPYETQTIFFKLSVEDFKAYNIDMIYTAENRVYKIKVGPNSRDLLEKTIKVFDG